MTLGYIQGMLFTQKDITGAILNYYTTYIFPYGWDLARGHFMGTRNRELGHQQLALNLTSTTQLAMPNHGTF